MNKYSREVSAAPAEIATNGRCNMGTFNQAIKNVNMLDVEKPLGTEVPQGLKFMRLKEWQAFQISNDEWFICLAVYNTKSIGLATVMAFDRNQQKMYRYERKVPFNLLKVPSGLADSRCYYHGADFRIDIHNNLDDGKFRVSFQADNFAGLPDLRASFTGYHETEPIVIVQPFDDNRPLYSHKALMPCEGMLELSDGRKSFFERGTGSMIIDDHKGYYPYTMAYDWVTGLGYDHKGRLAGFNTTDNQIQNHMKYNENCLWLDGQMYPLPPISIRRNTGVEGIWEVSDDFGRVRIFFKPLYDCKVKINAGIIKTDYHGPTGVLEGWIKTPDGEKVCFDGFAGMGEKKFIKG